MGGRGETPVILLLTQWTRAKDTVEHMQVLLSKVHEREE